MKNVRAYIIFTIRCWEERYITAQVYIVHVRYYYYLLVIRYRVLQRVYMNLSFFFVFLSSFLVSIDRRENRTRVSHCAGRNYFGFLLAQTNARRAAVARGRGKDDVDEQLPKLLSLYYSQEQTQYNRNFRTYTIDIIY